MAGLSIQDTGRRNVRTQERTAVRFAYCDACVLRCERLRGQRHPDDRPRQYALSNLIRSPSPAKGGVLGDPLISRLDELDTEASICFVFVAIPWHGWGLEIIERQEKPHCG